MYICLCLLAVFSFVCLNHASFYAEALNVATSPPAARGSNRWRPAPSTTVKKPDNFADSGLPRRWWLSPLEELLDGGAHEIQETVLPTRTLGQLSLNRDARQPLAPYPALNLQNASGLPRRWWLSPLEELLDGGAHEIQETVLPTRTLGKLSLNRDAPQPLAPYPALNLQNSYGSLASPLPAVQLIGLPANVKNVPVLGVPLPAEGKSTLKPAPFQYTASSVQGENYMQPHDQILLDLALKHAVQTKNENAGAPMAPLATPLALYRDMPVQIRHPTIPYFQEIASDRSELKNPPTLAPHPAQADEPQAVGAARIQNPNNVTVVLPFGLGTRHPSHSQVEAATAEFSLVAYGILLVVILISLVSLVTDLDATKKWIDHIKRGHFNPNANKPRKERLALKKERLDPKSDHFIAKGNIYRVMAVMHPGVVGWRLWTRWSVQALTCVAMQFNLPLFILYATMREWTVMGIKSPFSFVRVLALASQLIAFISLSAMFQARVSNEMTEEAEANYFLATHRRPTQEEEQEDQQQRFAEPTAGFEVADAGLAGNDDDSDSEDDEHNFALPTVSPRMIKYNEFFWLTLSQFNTFSSIVVQAIFIVQISTFNGQLVDAVLVAVGLYFVMDLEYNIMKANPHLKSQYRAEVLMHTRKREWIDPTWIKSLAMLAIGVSSAVVSFGVWVIIFVGWRSVSDGIEIGGPFP